MKYLTQNKWWDLVKDYNLDKMLYLLIDRPTTITIWNDFVWCNNIKNKHHRNYDLPARAWCDGDLVWFKNGKNCRGKSKPVVIYKYKMTIL